MCSSSKTLLGLSVLCTAALAAGPARAQEAAPAPAHIAAVDGSATLDRDGQPDQAVLDVPFVPGDHLRTTSGRVEILFSDGVALDVDQFTEISLESDSVIRLAEGRALLRVPGARYTTVGYRLMTPATSIEATGPGEYRLSYPDAFESARADEFERWIGDQSTAAAPVASASAQYLPPDLQMYGSTLDQYGGWQYDQSYGYVWYPTVAPTWRPYYDGYWEPIRPYGWTWIGMNAWSWPTHHYGRWGFHHSRWFWIPARSWAPAWVAWGAATDYVSWCPLGWDSRPVFALSVGHGDPWLGWTVVPRHAFGYSHVYVTRHVVSPHHLHLNSTPFIVQSRPPIATPRAIAVAGAGAGSPYRGQVPVQGPGTAVPRNGQPAAASRNGFYTTVPQNGTGAGSPLGQVPVQGPGTAVPRGTVPAYTNTAPRTPPAIDRRPSLESPANPGVTPGAVFRTPSTERRPMTSAPPAQGSGTAPPYRLPSMERRPMTVEPRASQAPVAVTPRGMPVAPPRSTPTLPGSATPRQEPIARPPAQPGPPPQAQPVSRPQTQPPASHPQSAQPAGRQQAQPAHAQPRGGGDAHASGARKPG